MRSADALDDAALVREFRLLRIRGSPVDALASPGIRRCLATCAEIRQRKAQSQEAAPDMKRLSAGDNDE